MVQFSPSNAGGLDSVPGRGDKIPHVSWPKNPNIKQKLYCNKFNKDFKNCPHQKNLKKNFSLGFHNTQNTFCGTFMQVRFEEPKREDESQLLQLSLYQHVHYIQ